MSDNLNTHQPELHLPIKKPGTAALTLKFTGYVVVLVLAVAALYQVFFMVRLTAGISNEKPGPEHLATVEIVNASGAAVNSALAKDKLDKVISEKVEIQVVKMERLEYKNINKSLVISRSENTELAELVASIIGLDKSEVVFRPSFEKDMSPAVTLVLGEDIQEVFNPVKPTKES